LIGALTSMPSDARNVNPSIPSNTCADVYVNDPFAFSVSVPWLTPVASDAVNASPSASETFASGPGAGTLSATPCATEYADGPPVGTAFGVTLNWLLATCVVTPTVGADASSRYVPDCVTIKFVKVATPSAFDTAPVVPDTVPVPATIESCICTRTPGTTA